MKENCILVVEDNEDIREVLKEVLEVEGYSVDVAVDGREAMSKLKNNPPPHLILLDLMLPHMNGWEVIDELKKDPEDTLAKVPIIILSAAGKEAQSAAKKVEGYLKKPVELSELLKAVEKYCPPA